jgi:molybdate transport system regulatory protein
MSDDAKVPTSREWQRALGHAASDKRLEVLRRIGRCGSISQAAREAGISYKAAWLAIDTLSGLAGVPLVQRVVGGRGGGGARLTPEGEQLLRLADAMAQARETVLARFAGTAPLTGTSVPVHGRGLCTSMRNQLPCRVGALPVRGRGEALLRVTLLPEGGGAPLVATLTRESADLLGLRTGLPVLALAKATAVVIAADPPAPPPGTSVLAGKVWRVVRGHVHDEVTLALPGGALWVGFAAHPFARRKGQPAHAWVPDSALVVALPR